MNVGILIIAIVDMLVGSLALVVFRPLAQGKIGRNGLYGFRTPKTLASDKAWYAANHGVAKVAGYLAIAMILFGSVVALLSIVVARLPSTMRDDMELALLFAPLGAPFVFVAGLWVAMHIELRKLDKSESEEML